MSHVSRASSFELADRWCSSIEGEAYGAFLVALLQLVAERQPPNSAQSAPTDASACAYVWRDEADIKYGGYDESKIVAKPQLNRKALVEMRSKEEERRKKPVSYTHLTLPTTD